MTDGLKRLEARFEARMNDVYNQGTNLNTSFQTEASINNTRHAETKTWHAETTGQLNGLQTTSDAALEASIDLKRSVRKAHAEENRLRREEESRRREEAREEKEGRREEAREEKEGRREEAREVARDLQVSEENRREEKIRRKEEEAEENLEAEDREKYAALNAEKQRQGYFLKGLEKTFGAASAAHELGEKTNAMLAAVLKGISPVKGPVRGQGTPGASARGQGTPTPLSSRVVSAAQRGLTKLSPSASTPLPKAAPGRAKPERRTPAARGQSTPAGAATPKPRTPVAARTRGQRTPATLTPGPRAPLSARVKSGAASAASAVAKLSPIKVSVCQKG